eukprot:CAMPEP_0176497646 /NCGR_PEP_ID=MMETSP0200_2-20121128/11842_1 /TAXON_ID=947934 /ORGANISM="Chaetoceros sp., Strain GSL56" /LENGTH=86 /DNA_ID=CAMNT_0017895687 /DNA_START=21 /DNA_END=281 /DNA_ORIENTATION=-
MKNFTILLTLAIIGLSAAFFRPAQPHQVPGAAAVLAVPNGGAFPAATSFCAAAIPAVGHADDGLDNPLIQEDDSITAARKCGFCMG